MDDTTEKNIVDDLDRNVVQINGPYNVVRLEGYIHAIKKVIYLFFDVHANVTAQTECTNIYAKDVNRYFAESFYELNNSSKKYDFFMEIRPTEIYPPEYFRKDKSMYIQEMAKMFSIILLYDKNKNKVNIRDALKNIRLHYLDIRDYLEHHIRKFVTWAKDTSLKILHMYYINHEYLIHIIEDLTFAKQQLDLVIAVLINPNYVPPTDKKESLIKDVPLIEMFSGFVPEIVSNMSNKMKNLYNHQDIKKIMNKIFDDQINDLKILSDNIGTCVAKLKEYQNILNNPESYKKLMENEVFGMQDYKYHNHTKLRYMMIDIIDMCDKIYEVSEDEFAKLTDIYFLRRFLDKDYITNAIVYTGGLHSMNYVEILIKYFDFKITHVAYSSIKDMDALTKEIKTKVKNRVDLDNLLKPPEFYQCSDITHFPKNFE